MEFLQTSFLHLENVLVEKVPDIEQMLVMIRLVSNGRSGLNYNDGLYFLFSITFSKDT